MTNLEQLKKEAREELSRQIVKFRPITSGATNDMFDMVSSLIDHIHTMTVEECIAAIKDAKEVHGSTREVLAWLEGRLQALITEPENI